MNPEDNFSRTWGLGIDNVPTDNWLKDPSIIKQSGIKSGEKWEFNFQLTDGKHVVYFIISQTPGALGSYAGEAIFGDKARFTFVGVDNDSVAAFEVNVRGGNFTKTGKSNQAPVTDIPTKGTFIPNLKGRFSFLRGIPLLLKNRTFPGTSHVNAWNVLIGTIIVASGAGIVIGVKRRMKRRF
jgi:hypothetical protein